jgi:hypothetical protein
MITNFKLFEQKEQNWKLILDISKIWNDNLYENNTELLSFNEQYIKFLNSQKNLIIKNTSENAWIKLEELIKRLTEHKDKLVESTSVWDDIYDWGDSNLVQIKVQDDTQTKTDF